MLTKGDDYPIHQTSEPIAYSGTDRNFYDRYWFNGYVPDGSIFFAVAFGIYPHVNIADAHIAVVVDGVQHNLDLATRAKVAGTPFFYIDGLGRPGIFRGAVPANILQEAIEKARVSN